MACADDKATPTSPKRLLSAWNLHPRKKLGQNFLADPSTARMIVNRSGLSPQDIVLEIGAGLGALTIPASAAVNRVYAVEKDVKIADLLANELRVRGIDNVILEKKDILDIDIKGIAEKEKKKLIVLGNLPYNISSQVVVNLINARDHISRAVLMFQKEVAQRLSAGPGSKAYGRLSVTLQYCASLKKVASIGAHLFSPRPKVDSQVLEIRFKGFIKNPVADEGLFSNVVKAAFARRRKTLKNALANSGLESDPKTAADILNSAGIDPSRRGETLSVSEFVVLTNAFFAHPANSRGFQSSR